MNNPFKVYTKKPEIKFDLITELPKVLEEFFGYDLLNFRIQDIDMDLSDSQDDFIWFPIKGTDFIIEITRCGVNYWYVRDEYDYSSAYIKFNHEIEFRCIYSILRDMALIISEGEYEFCGFDFNDLIS